MIDLFCVFTAGGLILWMKTYAENSYEEILNTFIKSVLIDEKRNLDFFKINGLIIRWKIINNQGLYFICAYREMYNLLYVDRLIDSTADFFVRRVIPTLKKEDDIYLSKPDFDTIFEDILKKWNEFVIEKKKEVAAHKFVAKKKPEEVAQESSKSLVEETKREEEQRSSSKVQLKEKKRHQQPKSTDSKKQSKKPTKENTVWNEIDTNIDEQKMSKYDHSQSKGEQSIEKLRKAATGDDEEDNIFDYDSLDEDTQSTGIFGRLTNAVKGIIGNKQITKEDLEPLMAGVIDSLMEKNVAKEVADSLCKSVSDGLIKTKTKSFTSVEKTLKEALKSTIQKILSPKREIDVLKEAINNKGRTEPYKIVFIGVNGLIFKKRWKVNKSS